jgi:hypothetical protein
MLESGVAAGETRWTTHACPSVPRRLVRALALVLATGAATGCAAMGGLVAGGALFGAAVGGPRARDSVTTVRFAEPTDIATLPMPEMFRKGLTDTVWVQNLVSVRGEIRAIQGDWVELDLLGAQYSGGRTEEVKRGTVRAFVRVPPATTTTEVKVRRQRFLGAMLGAGVVTLVMLGLALGASA